MRVSDERVQSLVWKIVDAKIDLAVKVATETLIDIDNVDPQELEAELAQIKRQGAWPRFQSLRKTVADVTTARGNFQW